jgi:cytochrome bd ubiquinol oxidase subunit II
MSAFYLPIVLLLFGLIFRGVAFEFRNRATTMRSLWERGFFLGSVVVSFVQGAAIGAMMRGIPIVNDQYAGGAFDWLHPFSILTGIGLVLGYALLGAGSLVRKSDGPLREWAYERIPWLSAGVFVTLGPAFLVSLIIDVEAIAAGNLHARLWIHIFPVLAAIALIGVIVTARTKHDKWPFLLTIMFFHRVIRYAWCDVLAVYGALFPHRC